MLFGSNVIRFACIWVLLLLSVLAFGQQERISSFEAKIVVDTSGLLSVTETIRVYAAGDKIKRGIYRKLPATRNINGRVIPAEYSVVSVQRNGQTEKYHTRAQNNFWLYIGEEDVMLPTGWHTYVIEYASRNQIGFFENYDEIYWNVTGTEWDFAIDSVSANVYVPNNAEVLQYACYTGRTGSKESECSAQKLSATHVQFATNSLQQRENLTVAVGFTKGVLASPPPPTWFQRNGMLLIGIALTLLLLIYYFTQWQRHGIDPQRPTVFPQFNVPENLSPASMAYIKNKLSSHKYLTASLVNLAVKAYVQIVEEKESKMLGLYSQTVYKVVQLREADDSLPLEEKRLMKDLFRRPKGALFKSVILDGKYDSDFAKTVKSYTSNLSNQYSSMLFHGHNLGKVILPLLLIIGYAVFAIWYNVQWTYNTNLVAVAIVLGGVAMALGVMGRALAEYWKTAIVIFTGVFALGIGVFLFFTAMYIRTEPNYGVILIMLVNLALLMIFSYLIKKPSEEKFRLQSLIAGFEMYLRTAEEQLLQYHNPPEMTSQQYEKLLPYAMVFGVDRIWGEKFARKLQQSGTESTYVPTWYVGNHAFNSNFASTLNSSMTRMVTSTSTDTSSSGSGSGGGGFSGGGGGGGGGGGW
ncbi:MAG: DUF2207 domain-containing protein [Weeksellaceae bacterium]|nr:DUF2207 domain-containing protein [Weeksellaceae bacterium]